MPLYVGRFAPTPSGALHFGSLVTAVGSWLDARGSAGLWRLRIDDLDRLRVKAGAETAILRQLADHGLNWDGPIRRQSEHIAEYRAALEVLRQQRRLYACRCTRAQLAAHHDEANEDAEPVYPGTCRDANHPDVDAALRFCAPSESVSGDFVVCRRDGIPAYQLACAVDEAAQGITDVVRGTDLVSSAMRQTQVMHALGLAVPRYRHLPLVLDTSGRKLGKRNEARPLEAASARQNLLNALAVLGQQRPVDADGLDPSEILAIASRGWQVERIPAAAHKLT